MAETEVIEQDSASAPDSPFVALTENADATVFVESEDEADSTAAESETTEQAEEKTETFLSDDDKDVDLSDPAYKAAYKRLLASYTKKVQKLQKDTKAEPAKAEPAPEPQAAAETQQAEWDPYTVPLEQFVYKGDPEPADSDLAGFEGAIDRRVQEGVKKAIEFTLNQMRANDNRLREQAQVGTARERIATYAEAIMAHPEYEAKAASLAEFAQNTRELAIKNPDKWIEMAELYSGIKRNWQEEALASDAQSEQQNQRLANKPRAVVQRPTSARAQLAAKPTGKMSVDEAFEAAWRERR